MSNFTKISLPGCDGWVSLQELACSPPGVDALLYIDVSGERAVCQGRNLQTVFVVDVCVQGICQSEESRKNA